MFEELATNAQNLITITQKNAHFSIKIIAVLWLSQVINIVTRYRLNYLGILPRRVRGLIGIFISPFLHGSFSHLFFNTFPLFVLSDLVLTEGRFVFYCVSGVIVVLSGLLLWLFGRRGIHIGASGLIMGYFGYLLAKAYFNITETTIILAGVTLYYFGGMFLCLFPGAQKNMSWEGHVFGFLSGIATAYFINYLN